MSDWKTLDSEAQLSAILEISRIKPVLIYKHSTRCPVCTGVKSELEKNWDVPANVAEFYYLDLIKYREISAKVSQLFNVIHQSPQLIIIKNGKAVQNESHWAISTRKIKQALR